MKKYISLFLAVIVLSGVLTSCSHSLKGGAAVVTDLAGKGYAAVTKEDGGIERDAAGNVIVLETDADGKNVTGENGEYVSNAVRIEHAIVVGDRIEARFFSMKIPDGWSDKTSYSDLIISRDGTKDQLIVSFFEDTTLEEKTKERLKLYDSIKSMYSATGKFSDGEVTISGQKATFYEGFVDPEGEETEPVYVCFYFFEYGGIVYSCYISSNHDLTGTKDFTNILNTIEFI